MQNGGHEEKLTYGQLGQILINANEANDHDVADWARGMLGAQSVGTTRFREQAGAFLKEFDQARDIHESTYEGPNAYYEKMGWDDAMVHVPMARKRIVTEKDFGMLTPSDAFFMDPEFHDANVWEGAETAIYNAEVLTGPLVEQDGKRFVETSSGLVPISNYDEFAEAASDALKGSMPGTGNFVHDGVMLFDNPLFGITDDIETPAGNLPFAIGIAEDVETERALLRDPREMRAVMEAAGKHDQGWFESAAEVAASAAGPLAEFIGVAKLAGWGGKALGAGVRAASTSERLGVLGRVANSVRGLGGSMQSMKAAQSPRVLGVAFDARQALLEEPLYAITRNLVTGNGTALEGAIEGVAEGTAEAAISGFGRISVRNLAKGLTKVGIDNRTLRLIASETSDRAGIDLVDDLIDRRVKNRDLIGESLRRHFGDTVTREHVMTMLDIASVSVAFGSYGAAQREAAENGEDWNALGWWEKGVRMASNMASPEVAGQAAIFGGAMATQMGAQRLGLANTEYTEEQKKFIDGLTQQVLNTTVLSGPDTLSGWAVEFDGLTAEQEMERIGEMIDEVAPPPVVPESGGDGPVQPDSPGGLTGIEAAGFRHGAGVFSEPARMSELATQLPSYPEESRARVVDAAALSAQHTGHSLSLAAAVTGQSTRALQERRASLLKGAMSQHGERVRRALSELGVYSDKQLNSWKKMEPFLLAAMGMPGHPSGGRQSLSRAELNQEASRLESQADSEAGSSQEAARLRSVAERIREASRRMPEFHPVPDVMERIRTSLKGTKKLGDRDPDVVTSQVYSELAGVSAFASPSSQVESSARRSLTPVDSVLSQAGSKANSVVQALQMSKIVPEHPDDIDADHLTSAFRAISQGDTQLLQMLAQVHGEEAGIEMFRSLRTRLNETIGLTQQAAVMKSVEMGDPTIPAYLSLVEQMSSDGSIPPGAVEAVAEKHGRDVVGQYVLNDRVQDWAHEDAKAWWDQNMSAGSSPGERAMIGAYNPMDALTGYYGSSQFEGSDYLVYRESKIRDAIERMGEKSNRLTRALYSQLLKIHRVVGRGQTSPVLSKKQQLTNSRFRHALTDGDNYVRHAIGKLENLLVEISTTLGGLNSRDRAMLLKIHEHGGFARIDSEEAFAKKFAGLGHLYGIGRRQNELMNQLGQELVNVGYLTREQFEAHRDRYSLFLRKAKDLTAEESAQKLLQSGLEGLNLPGRDIEREASGQADWENRVWDPLLVMPVQVAQETGAIGMMRMLNAVIDGSYGEIGLTPEQYGELSAFQKKGWKKAADMDGGPAQKRLYLILQDMKNGMEYDAFNQLQGDREALQQGLRNGTFEHHADDTYSGEGVRPLLRRIKSNEEKVRNSRRPTTSRKVELIRRYLEEGVYVTHNISDEMHFALEELFNRPDMERWSNRVLMGVERTARAWRKAKTVMNPKHHTLNMISSVMTNHATGGVPMQAFVRALAGEKNEYNIAGSRLQEWRDYLETNDGDVSSAPAHIREVHEVAEILGGSTLWSSMLEADSMWDMIGSVVSGTTVQLSGDSAADFMNAHLQLTESLAGSQAAFDMKFMKMLGASDPQKAARAVQLFAGQYQMNELFFKLANYYYLRRNNPGMSIRQAALAGAQGTADYADSSPILRRWGSKFTPMSSDLFRKTETKFLSVPVDRLARLMFGSPFQIYRAYMLPTLAHAALKHPWRRVGIMGALGITAAALGGDDDDAFDAAAGGPGRAGMPLSDEARRRVADLMGPIDEGLKGVGDALGFAPDPDGKMRKEAGSWFKGLLRAAKKVPVRALQLEPYSFQAPSKPGDLRMSSFEDFDFLTDVGLDVARGVRAAAEGSPMDAVRHAAEGMYGLVPDAMIGGVLSGFRILQGESGKPRSEVAVEELQNLVRQAIPVGSPAWAFSPANIKGQEVLSLNGKTFLEAVKGIERIVEDPDRDALKSFLFSEVWRSERISSRNQARVYQGSLVDALFNLDGSKIKGAPNSDELTEAQRVARGRVLEQVTSLMVDSYVKHRRGEYGQVSFDDAIHTELGLEADLHRKPNGVVDVNKRPKTTLGIFLSRQEPEVREQAIDDAQRLLTRMYQGPAMYAAVEAARHGRVEPPVYRRLFQSALRDPGGEGLVRLMSEEMGLRRMASGVEAQGDTSNMAAYYSLFIGLNPDVDRMSSVGRKKYHDLFDFFSSKSMEIRPSGSGRTGYSGVESFRSRSA